VGKERGWWWVGGAGRGSFLAVFGGGGDVGLDEG